MENREEIYQIINRNVLEISKKVAGILLSQSCPVEMMETHALHLSAVGTYQFDLYLRTDKRTLEHIASNMKKAPATEEEIMLYTIEFFNILGGRIVSTINRNYGQSARFRPPVFSTEEVPNVDLDQALTLFYRYRDSNVKIEGRFVNKEAS